MIKECGNGILGVTGEEAVSCCLWVGRQTPWLCCHSDLAAWERAAGPLWDPMGRASVAQAWSLLPDAGDPSLLAYPLAYS